MVKIPKIALFEAHESIAASINQIFAKSLDFYFERVQTPEELSERQREDAEPFNIIVIPSVLHDRASAVKICLLLKSEPLLTSIPVIVLSHIRDMPAISTFYGAGADIVMPLPVEFEMLNCQVNALYRLNQSLVEEQQMLERDRGLRQAIINALHFVEEPLVILDPSANVVFSNQAAKQLLNLYDDLHSTSIQRAYTALQNICMQAMQKMEADSAAHNNTAQQIVSYNNISLQKNSGEKIRTDVRVAPLKAAGGETIAYCLSIVDISAPGEISGLLMQLERTQYLSLLFGSACMQLIGANSLGNSSSAQAKIEQVFARQDPVCSLTSVTTSLLEFIDSIALSGQMLRFNLPDNIRISMKSSHLFLLIGNVILFSLRSASSRSETSINFHTSGSPSSASLKVRTQNLSDYSQSKDKLTSSAIRTEFLALAAATKPGTIISLEKAKSIAALYRLQLLERTLNDGSIEIEIELPLAV